MDKSKFNDVFPIICSELAKKISTELNLKENETVT